MDHRYTLVMNRRTFFTSLASLGASPALGVGPAITGAVTLANPADVVAFYTGQFIGVDPGYKQSTVTVTSIDKRAGSFSYVSDLVDNDYVFRASRP
jgi:hypothetical protein